jgi:ABC-type Na+ efflux pump permease subunit
MKQSALVGIIVTLGFIIFGGLVVGSMGQCHNLTNGFCSIVTIGNWALVIVLVAGYAIAVKSLFFGVKKYSLTLKILFILASIPVAALIFFSNK